jgi:hypothetical protein
MDEPSNDALTDRIHRIAEAKYPSPDLRDVLVRADDTVKMVIVHNRKRYNFDLGPDSAMYQMSDESLERNTCARGRSSGKGLRDGRGRDLVVGSGTI